MKTETPRLRMFAGPNGSGKSTLKSTLNSKILGVYINPDEIEKEIQQRDFLDLSAYGVVAEQQEILDFFLGSLLLKKAGLLDEAEALCFSDNKLGFHNVIVNSYFASVAADFIRQKLVDMGKSLTFETVMSSPDKIDFLRAAQRKGYRTYLYFVSTEDPSINISRVSHRVKMGGHPVPEEKIISRFSRSLDLLMDAIACSDRAYIFDNSGKQQVWIAEITDGKWLEMKTENMPNWFSTAVLDKAKP